MYKKLLLGLVCTAALGFAVPTTSHAAPENDPTLDKTDVEIGFQGANTPTNGPFKNKLSLVYRPTAFKFGVNNDTTGTLTTFKNSITDKQYLVVNEDRETGSKWDLTANLSELKTADGTQTLPATLQFTTDNFQGYDIGTNMNATNDDYIPNALTAEHLSVLKDPADILGGSNKVVAGATDEVSVLKNSNAARGKGGVAARTRSAELVVANSSGLGGKKFSGEVSYSLSVVPGE
ncbi:hypothetical protein DOK67_0001100 [Enterococcus sp. DIV0212c]|uniref:WxL domain-containing protein n=1 Tax=Enterococcus sp. DIV0212c TaxID=2230867 RepID=UPI001A9C01B1|nr:WxL domain-containing protein [Enterococcus sp. DIV0212c]MBO1354458.1 WxL domain-containing protein [Enterococcus sp. DIV0212c]